MFVNLMILHLQKLIFLTYRNNLLLKRPNLEQYETHPTTKLSIYIGSNIAKFS